MTRWLAWLVGERESFIADWTPERAEKAHRQTLRMLGRGETVYTWSAKIKALKQRSNLRRFEARKSA